MERIREGGDIEILAVGKMTSVGIEVCKKLRSRGIDAGLTNVRFVKPFDEDAVLAAAEHAGKLVTLEDNVLEGGFGSMIARFLAEKKKTNIEVLNIGWPDQFIEQGSTAELFEKYGLDPESLAERVSGFLEGKA